MSKQLDKLAENIRGWIPQSASPNVYGPSRYQVGFDPEVFLEASDGSLLPGFRVALPQPEGQGVGPYRDGFACEFNTKPKTCMAYAQDTIQAGLQATWNLAQKHKAHICLQDVRFIENIHEYAPSDIELGCSPSANVYGEPPMTPRDPYSLPFRTIGCHVHFGAYDRSVYPVLVQNQIPGQVKALDYLLGPVMTSLLEGLEDPTRRSVYGRAGEFRPKSYGFEYRVPSAAVLWHPAIFSLVMTLARNICILFDVSGDPSGGLYGMQCKTDPDTILPETSALYEHSNTIINYLDVDAARAFLQENSKFYLAMISDILSYYGSHYNCTAHGHPDRNNTEYFQPNAGIILRRTSAEAVLNFILTGARRAIDATPKGLEAAWLLNASSGIVNDAPFGSRWIRHSVAPNAQVSFAEELYSRGK